MTTKKITSRAGVRVSSTRPSTGSTAPRRRVARKTQSERRTPKPRTAYDLLARVCEHILDEPRRYFQERWIVRNKAHIKSVVGSVPSCGTMACRAGWIVALHDGLNARVMRQAAVCQTGARASQILDIDTYDTSELFSGDQLHEETIGRKPPMYGTAAYARLGVKGLRAFMRQHKSHLKARLLKDVPKKLGQP